MFTLAHMKPIKSEFLEHYDYGFILTDSGSGIDGNYVYFNGDVDPTTRSPQTGDKFCIAKQDMTIQYFLYQGSGKWGMFQNDGRSPDIESNVTDKWPWDPSVTWSGVSGSISSSAKFEFRKIRWSGITCYTADFVPSAIIYSGSDLTLDPQETLTEDDVWIRQDTGYHLNKIYIQHDEDGYRWYADVAGEYNENRTYYAKPSLEELGWPWDHYDWYDFQRDYWMAASEYYDFRNMDNVEKVNEGPYNVTVHVTNGSNEYDLICKNNDENSAVMPYCRFKGKTNNDKEVILRLMWYEQNKYKWILQPYGKGGYDIMSNETFDINSLVWPWDSGITWTSNYTFTKK